MKESDGEHTSCLVITDVRSSRSHDCLQGKRATARGLGVRSEAESCCWLAEHHCSNLRCTAAVSK